MILKFLPHRVDKLYRWGWDLLWRSRFFHTNFHLISIRVGAWGHKTKNFMQFRNINAPQGRVHWVVYKIFRVCEECHIRSHIKTRADSLWEFRVASYGCIFPKVLAPTGSKTIHQRRQIFFSPLKGDTTNHSRWNFASVSHWCHIWPWSVMRWVQEPLGNCKIGQLCSFWPSMGQSIYCS